MTTYLRGAHSAQSGLPPVPERQFSRSMLFPVLQLVLLWCTVPLTEFHEFVLLISVFPIQHDAPHVGQRCVFVTRICSMQF